MRSLFSHLTDDQFLAQCEVDTYRASGPGGQKRNKTSSAVRLRHLPSGVLVIAEESRSQHENKAKALRRLRQTIQLQLREPIDPESVISHPDFAPARDGEGRLHLSAKNPLFWPAVGVVLDALTQAQGQVSTAAEWLGTSTANLIGFLQTDPKLWQEVNRLRTNFELKPLRNSG
jgi:hypothetical protein